jgi:predicted MFS family arabinose efflux permease
VPIRVGLAGAVVMSVLLPLPETVLVLAAALVAIIASLGTFWAPAMAMLSDSSERAGLDQALAFSIANLAWAGGHVLGGGGGAALADATADALVYGLLGAACAVTLAWVMAVSRSSAREPSRSGGTA